MASKALETAAIWVLLALGTASALPACSGSTEDAAASGGSDADASGGETSSGGLGGSDTGGSDTGGTTSGGSGGEAGQDDIDWGDCTYDPGLAENIRWALGGIDSNDVLDLVNLSVDHAPYSSLTGIECLENLEWVSLSYYFPEGERPEIDLSPLSSLEKLASLSVTTAGVSHLENLAEGPLRSVRLSWVDLDSLEPLRDFAELESLELIGLPAADLAPLGGLHALSTLSLEYLPVTSLAPLSGLEELQALSIWSLELQNLAGFVALPKLAELRVIETPLQNLEGIADVPSLLRVHLESCTVLESFDGVEECEALQSIEVSHFENTAATVLSNLDALAEVPTLEELIVPEAQLSDLTPLASCSQLRHLDLEQNEVADLSPLADLPLEWLDISLNEVESIEPLADLPLTTLRLSSNAIADFTPLRTLSELHELDISHTGATALDYLEAAPITHLYAADNSISDIDVVMEWELVDLFLSENEITTLPDGFVGGQGFCSRTELTGNPLDEAAEERLEALCAEPSAGSGYAWDGGVCSPICNVP